MRTDKALFSRECYLSMIHLPYVPVNFHHFVPCGTLLHVLSTQVMWHYEELLIRAIDEDR